MQDYVFALLTGYTDPPAGTEINEPQVFNAYFPVSPFACLLTYGVTLYNKY